MNGGVSRSLHRLALEEPRASLGRHRFIGPHRLVIPPDLAPNGVTVVLELLDLVSRRRGVRELRREPGLATMAGLPAVATIHRALVRVPLILVLLVAVAPRIGLGRAEPHGSRVVGRVVLAGITREREPWAVWIMLLIADAVAVKRA